MWFCRSWRSGRGRRRRKGWWGGSGRFGRWMSRRGSRDGKRSGIGSRGSEWRNRERGDFRGGDGGVMIDDGNGVFHCIAHNWGAYHACCLGGSMGFGTVMRITFSSALLHNSLGGLVGEAYFKGLTSREILPMKSIRTPLMMAITCVHPSPCLLP